MTWCCYGLRVVVDYWGWSITPPPRAEAFSWPIAQPATSVCVRVDTRPEACVCAVSSLCPVFVEFAATRWSCARSYRRSGRTDSIHRCTYECHRCSQLESTTFRTFFPVQDWLPTPALMIFPNAPQVANRCIRVDEVHDGNQWRFLVGVTGTLHLSKPASTFMATGWIASSRKATIITLNLCSTSTFCFNSPTNRPRIATY